MAKRWKQESLPLRQTLNIYTHSQQEALIYFSDIGNGGARCQWKEKYYKKHIAVSSLPEYCAKTEWRQYPDDKCWVWLDQSGLCRRSLAIAQQPPNIVCYRLKMMMRRWSPWGGTTKMDGLMLKLPCVEQQLAPIAMISKQYLACRSSSPMKSNSYQEYANFAYLSGACRWNKAFWRITIEQQVKHAICRRWTPAAANRLIVYSNTAEAALLKASSGAFSPATERTNQEATADTHNGRVYARHSMPWQNEEPSTRDLSVL